MQELGKCPICNKEAIIIDKAKPKALHLTIHKNEYYCHSRSSEGEDYIMKFKPARTPKNRFK